MRPVSYTHLDTDWEDAIQRTGSRTDIGVSVSGGNNKSDYYLSAGYLTEGGYIIGSKFDRYTLNTNVNSQITSFLKIGGTPVSYTHLNRS